MLPPPFTMSRSAPLLALTVTLVLAGCSTAPRYDLVLAGGRVMDPASGLDAVRHIGIRGGRIQAISEAALTGTEVVEVTGHVVAPGFIDLHAHGQTTGDMQIQARDGVTTALDMEVGVFPVASWYASMAGKSPLNYGATVSHIAARFTAFHPGLEIGHWVTSPGRPRAGGSRRRASSATASRAAGSSST